MDSTKNVNNFYCDIVVRQNEKTELLQVIGDFLEMGHVDNIIAMFKKDPSLYDISGDLLRDERFSVRLGMAVLFEELVVSCGQTSVSRAIPSLSPLLQEATPTLRGEAATLLGIINTDEALTYLKPLCEDPDPQVSEIVKDIVKEI